MVITPNGMITTDLFTYLVKLIIRAVCMEIEYECLECGERFLIEISDKEYNTFLSEAHQDV